MTTHGYEIAWVSDGQGGERADVRVGSLLVRLRVWCAGHVYGKLCWVPLIHRVMSEEEARASGGVVHMGDEAPGFEVRVAEPFGRGNAGDSIEAMRQIAEAAFVRAYGLASAWASAIDESRVAERDDCVRAVAALAEDPHGDLGHDWSGGWEAAIEEAVAKIKARVSGLVPVDRREETLRAAWAALYDSTSIPWVDDALDRTNYLLHETERLRDHVTRLRVALAVDHELRTRLELGLVSDVRAGSVFRLLDALRALNSGAMSDGDATTVASRAYARAQNDARAVAQDYVSDLCLYYARAATTALHPTLPIVDRLEAHVDEAALRGRLEAHLDGQDDRRAAIGWLAARVGLLTPERYESFVCDALQDAGPLDDLGLRRHTEALVVAADGPDAFDAGMYAAAVEDLMDQDAIRRDASGGWSLSS